MGIGCLQSHRTAARNFGRRNCLTRLSFFLHRIEDFPPKPVEIFAGKTGIHAHVWEIQLLVGFADGMLLREVISGRSRESGQATDRSLEYFVAINGVAEPGEVRG